MQNKITDSVLIVARVSKVNNKNITFYDAYPITTNEDGTINYQFETLTIDGEEKEVRLKRPCRIAYDAMQKLSSIGTFPFIVRFDREKLLMHTLKDSVSGEVMYRVDTMGQFLKDNKGNKIPATKEVRQFATPWAVDSEKNKKLNVNGKPYKLIIVYDFEEAEHYDFPVSEVSLENL